MVGETQVCLYACTVNRVKGQPALSDSSTVGVAGGKEGPAAGYGVIPVSKEVFMDKRVIVIVMIIIILFLYRFSMLDTLSCAEQYTYYNVKTHAQRTFDARTKHTYI